MYNYTNLNKEYYYQIEYVDYDIELMGLTIDKLSYSSISSSYDVTTSYSLTYLFDI